MKFSENWLREFVAIDASREQLAKSLTMAGLEVEAIEPIGSALPGVVVGEIVECIQHPNADRLRVCKVNAGGNDVLQIVCGAPNARVGLKAPLATIGTIIPNAAMPNGMQIKQAALRGVESFGMLCSAVELGVNPDASGLLELPSDAPVGMPIANYLQLPDASIEIKLTPNRPDCLGLLGLARDVAAQFGVRTNEPAIASVANTIDDARAVKLAAPTDCPRYLGRVIRGIDPNAKSPFWMVEKLRRAGLRSIHPVVDITNLVMIELGQPMHGFDHDALHGEIVVRRARAQEKLKLLDEREVELDDSFLVIADAASDGKGRAVAIAGVMGGWDTRVSDATRNVFFEAAHFAPPAIVGRARKLGLHTDASHRFERGVDPNLPLQAIERATQLLLEIAGGQAGPLTHAQAPAQLPVRASVRLRKARLAQVLGMDVPAARVFGIFESLGMQVSESTDAWTVTPPSSRFDIEIEEDLIEEVARIHGYNQIPTHAPRGTLMVQGHSETLVPEQQFRRAMLSRGYDEALNFSFIAEDLLKAWSFDDGAIALANPLSADLGVMRTSLLPGLLEALKRNLARQQARVRLFEIGKSFHQGSNEPIEIPRLAMVACGAALEEQWSSAKRAMDFYDLKGDVEHLLGLSGETADWRFERLDQAAFHSGQSAKLLRNGVEMARIGAIHPLLAKNLGLDETIWMAELILGDLSQRTVPKAVEMSKFPSIRRDLAFVVVQTVAWSDLAKAAQSAGGDLVQDVFLFDQFAGPGIEAGCKSLAMGLILQDSSRTLTVEDADACVAAIIAQLKDRFGATLRG